MLRLDYDNIYSLGLFNNGFAPIDYYNEESKKHYFSLINESGKLVFEPVEIDLPQTGSRYEIETDGETVVVSQAINKENAKSYDKNGNLMASINLEDLNGYGSYNLIMSDGVIWAVYSYNLRGHRCYLLNPDFTPVISQNE